jgi:hypothetical protein
MSADLWIILLLLKLLAATVFAIAIVICLAVTIISAFARIRRKGYRPFAASVPILASGTLAILIAISLLTAGPLPADNLFWLFSVLAIAMPLIFVSVVCANVRLLPRRQNRIFGPRRVGSTLITVG